MYRFYFLQHMPVPLNAFRGTSENGAWIPRGMLYLKDGISPP